jgi:hypothetical protein
MVHGTSTTPSKSLIDSFETKVSHYFTLQGTAVNPLLRAAYLHDRMQQINYGQTNSTKQVKSWVTLVIPWLELEEDQKKLYNDRVFSSPQEQEAYVRDWLGTQAKMPNAAANLNIVFYNARYHAGLGSVFAMGDIIKQLPQDELDVCILEEPEVSFHSCFLSFQGNTQFSSTIVFVACQLVSSSRNRVDKTVRLRRWNHSYQLL